GRPVDAAGGEVVAILRVAAVRSEVGRDVGGVRGDRDRLREVDLLPPARGLAGEGGGSELGSGRAPEVADVGARVARTLVEAERGHEAGLVGLEPDAEL